MENNKKSADKISKELNWRYMLFDSLSFPTLIINPDKIILDINHNLKKKLSANKNLIGKTCHEYFFNSKTPCESATCPLPKLFADKKGQSKLIKIDTDMEDMWEDRVFIPILNENDEVAFIRVSIRDATQVKALEKELQDVRNLMEKIVQSSASSIVAADIRGNALLMNEAAENLFDYSLEEFQQNHSAKDFYPPGVAKEIMKKLRSKDYGGKGKLTSTKIDIVNSKGEIIPGEIAAAIIYEGNQEVATMGIYTDLRDKIAVEKKLEKAQKQLAQSEKLASIGQLAAGVAHEINNPLTGILFNANLLLEEQKEGSIIYSDLKYIIEDVNRCKRIVKDLLVYSRQANPAKNFVQLNMLVDQSLSLIHDQKLFGNIKIEKKMSEEMMLINVDENHLNQVIINLVMNARDAMNGKGILTLHTYRNKAAQKAYLEVSDTGCGIPEKNLHNIFDPFFTTKEPGKGTGLGLSTVYGIMQENGGNISVKETSPKGTTFLIELPLYSSLQRNQES